MTGNSLWRRGCVPLHARGSQCAGMPQDLKADGRTWYAGTMSLFVF